MLDVKSEGGLKLANNHFADNAFVNGFALSHCDAQLATDVGASVDAARYPHIARWCAHVRSYTDAERNSWPKASGSCDTAASAKKPAAGGDDFDLFGSDEEEDSAEKERITQERVKAYSDKKALKPALIAKSNIIYDVKPWDDTIDTKEIEAHVRKIEADGLVWGASKIVPIAYGIKKLQICCVVEDDKVSTDWLEESIVAIEDLVQSVDVVAFNKV